MTKPIPSCFIQINVGEEPQKAGIYPHDFDSFFSYCSQTLQLPITGLMAIPPQETHVAPYFALLKKLCYEYQLKECSMGMSNDYDEAIRQGSTIIRVGTAIFGQRA